MVMKPKVRARVHKINRGQSWYFLLNIILDMYCFANNFANVKKFCLQKKKEIYLIIQIHNKRETYMENYESSLITKKCTFERVIIF